MNAPQSSPPPQLPKPDEPLKVALIGAGNRSRTIYEPLFPSVAPWLTITAICDPVQEHGAPMAERLGARYYPDIHALVRDRPMEAALVVTPVPSHYAISVFLSSHGIHNQCETSWCSMISQARQMISVARENRAVVRVGENFYRFPIDRFAQTVKSSGYLGPIHRIFCYADHTGYHNDSRWIRFAEAHPLWVQAISHSMPTPAYRSMPHRFHRGEGFHGRYIMFPGNLLVVDQAPNVKGLLGRHPRPGYTEWQGERGTLVHQAARPAARLRYDGPEPTRPAGSTAPGCTELRWCDDAEIDPEHGVPTIEGRAGVISPVIEECDETSWLRSYAYTPRGLLEYVNPHRPRVTVNKSPAYGVPVMGHMIDFVAAVRGLWKSEFDEQDALMSLMMEVGAHESVAREGQRVRLPLEGEPEADAITREQQRREHGVDPLDVEAMMAISYPRP
jgi:hypothetical protein